LPPYNVKDGATMWKRITLCIAAMAVLFTLTGCGDKETGKYKDQDKPKADKEK